MITLKQFVDEREEVIFFLLFIVGTTALFTEYTNDVTYFSSMGALYGLLLGKKGADNWMLTRNGGSHKDE
jgi:hypothetical protein